MNAVQDNKVPCGHQKGSTKMEMLIILSVLVLWLVLQAWVLPRFGVPT